MRIISAGVWMNIITALFIWISLLWMPIWIGWGYGVISLNNNSNEGKCGGMLILNVWKVSVERFFSAFQYLFSSCIHFLLFSPFSLIFGYSFTSSNQGIPFKRTYISWGNYLISFDNSFRGYCPELGAKFGKNCKIS